MANTFHNYISAAASIWNLYRCPEFCNVLTCMRHLSQSADATEGVSYEAASTAESAAAPARAVIFLWQMVSLSCLYWGAVAALSSPLVLLVSHGKSAGDRNKQRFELLVPAQQGLPRWSHVEMPGARDTLAGIVLRHPGEEMNSDLPYSGWWLLGTGHSDPRSKGLTGMQLSPVRESPPFLSPCIFCICAELQWQGKEITWNFFLCAACSGALLGCPGSVLCAKEISSWGAPQGSDLLLKQEMEWPLFQHEQSWFSSCPSIDAGLYWSWLGP